GVAVFYSAGGRDAFVECWAELHWYEAHGIGKRHFKIRRVVEEAESIDAEALRGVHRERDASRVVGEGQNLSNHLGCIRQASRSDSDRRRIRRRLPVLADD